MSLVENQALRNDTLDYIRQTPIISFDLEQLSPDGGEHLKMKIADSELWSVKGKSRIVATDLLRKGDSVIVKVKLKAEDLGAAVANDWMPTYWLPWGRNRVVRTTLRPRSLTTRTGAPKEGKDLDITRIHVNNVHYAQDSNDPVFFLTSSVNGCAVFVEGPEEQPTVYHGNAIGVKDEQGRGPMDLALAGKGGGELAQDLIGQKVTTMQDQFNRLSGGDPKLTRGADPFAGQAAKVITQADYQMLVSEGKIGSGFESEAKRVITGVAGEKGVRNKEVRLKKSQGTVFGLRKGGKLKFYYQKLVFYEIWRDVAPKWKRAQWEKDVSKPPDWHGVASGEFWPYGPGRAL